MTAETGRTDQRSRLLPARVVAGCRRGDSRPSGVEGAAR
ncbi:hypothetical protein OG871_36685 [Kitasatospora sp. NBC_00374]